MIQFHLLWCCLLVGAISVMSHDSLAKPASISLREEGAKVHPTVYLSSADVQRARENVEKFAWARETSDAIKKDADFWLAKDDAWLRSVVPPAGSAFAYGFTGCPICGSSWGTWGGARASFDNPGHVTCLKGHTLPDAEHPDPGEGYIGKDKRIHYFIGSYNAWVVETLTFKAINNLTYAYTLTGDERYAAKAALILDALAAVYPGNDKGSWDYPSNPPSGRFARPWYQVSRVLVHYTDYYDQLFNSPSLNQPSLTAGMTRRQNIETNLLKNGAAYCYEQSLKGGLHNGEADYIRGVLAVGVCLGIPEYVKWATDGPYGIFSLLENNIDRNGGYYETSIGYADHTRDLYFTFAEPLINYRGSAYPNGVNLYEHPKFRNFLLLHNLSQDSAGHSPRYGDSAPDIDKIIPPARPYDRSDYTFLERLHARSTGNEQAGYAALLRWLTNNDVEKQRTSFPVNAAGEGFPLRKWLLFHAPSLPENSTPVPDELLRRVTGSDFMGQKGIGFLRSGEGETAQTVLLRFGPSLNHGHLDDLNFNFYSRGYELTYDLGYGLGSTHTQVGWARQTASHNLVVVNEAPQGTKPANVPITPAASPTTSINNGSGGSLHLFAAMPIAKVMEASSEASYAAQGVSQYRRTLALIGNGPGSYLLDIFRVRGGKQHDYLFHAPSGEADFSGVEFGPEEKGSLAGPDIEWGNKQLNDGDMAGYPNKPYWNPPPGNGYGFLVQPRRAQPNTQKAFSADWKIDDATRLRLTMPASDSELITAVAPGIYPRVGYGVRRELPKARFIVARRRGENLGSEFIATLEPHGGTPVVVNVERLPLENLPLTDSEPSTLDAVAPVFVRVTLSDGSVDYIYSSADDQLRRSDNGGFFGHFAGRFAHLRTKDGWLLSLSMTGMKEFSGFGWHVNPKNAGWNGEIAQVNDAQHMVTTSTLLPTDGSLNGQVIVFSNPKYSRTSAYRIARVEAEGKQRRVYLDATTILGKGQVESIPDGKTLISSIPHDYTRSVVGLADGSGFFQGKTIRTISGAKTSVVRARSGSPMKIEVADSQGFRVGDVFYYHDLQADDRFEILSNASISGEPRGRYRFDGVNKSDVSPPRGAPF